jgi:hypothetical protein
VSRKTKTRQPETALYPPVKAFLEGQGYTVKGEIGRCDVVAKRGDEPALVVELKTSLNLELLLQGVERLSVADAVYLAVPAPRTASPVFDRRMHKLLRRLGLGLLLVHAKTVEAVLDPAPYQPRKNKRRTARLLSEFARRVGDPNQGGSSHRVKLVTAYRQEALRVASVLAARGPQKPARLRVDAEAPNAGRILLQDVYGWFERVERGIYALTPSGTAALQTYLGRFATPVCLVPPDPSPSSPDLIRRSTLPRRERPADQVRG